METNKEQVMDTIYRGKLLLAEVEEKGNVFMTKQARRAYSRTLTALADSTGVGWKSALQEWVCVLEIATAGNFQNIGNKAIELAEVCALQI